MMKASIAAAAFAVFAAAAPATATIVIYATPGSVQPEENVLFQAGPAVGNTAPGVTNQSNTLVAFLGNEPLFLPAMGQARLEAADGGLNFLEFGLDDDTLGFTEVEFNISGTQRTATSATLVFTDQLGGMFNQTIDLTNGQNFFSAASFDDQFITNVSITLNGGDVKDIRQFRIGGIAELDGGGIGNPIPEPATWALMIVGFGLVGMTARRRRITSVIA